MRKYAWVVLVGLFIAGLAGSAVAGNGSSLSATLQTEKWAYERSEEVTLRFSLANTGTESAYILRWQTPVAGVEADLFEVEVDGQPVAYIGKLIKRAAPQPEDFMELAPGETVTATFDLSAVYDMTREGEYTVRYRGELDELYNTWGEVEGRRFAKAPKQVVTVVESNAVSLYSEAREQQFGINLSALQFGGTQYCDSGQVTKLKTAHTNAQSYSSKAVNWLNTNPDSYTLYIKWFGAYASTRYNTVKSHFNAVYNAFATKNVTYDCSCTEPSYYAYVYPSQPYMIYLCGYFWKAGATGTDSQAGTLVHEMSHFNVTAGTQDYVYGQTAALRLAKTQPKKAINNADNHEYFAEAQK